MPRLTDDETLARLTAHDHGVLCTVHPERGVDAVPVVYAVDDGHLGIPVDRVKPKASMRLQREKNLEADPRATLLVEHWDRADWSKLWWVRVELRFDRQAEPDREAALSDLLVGRYRHYEDRPFAKMLVFSIVGRTGWAASPGVYEPA